jgi:gamma-glutamyltranspeptidase/glutathione hydrolase
MLRTTTVLGLVFLLCPSAGWAGEKAVTAKNGMVVSVSPAGTDVGVAVLRQGGNAVDAAVAVAFALAVTYPAAGNIGGGGFMVVFPGGKAEPVVIDYRETAPKTATLTMFKKGDSVFGHKVVGVPGTVRGLALAHQKFGKLPWKDVVLPAVKLAEDGFILPDSLASSLNNVVNTSDDFPALQQALGKDGKGRWRAGDRLVQKDLARTLRLIAEKGPDAFYTGEVADLLAAEMKAGGGLITRDDLAAYEARQRRPIHGTYRGHDVYGPPPPSSGGICLVQMLNVLENYDLKKWERYSPRTLHVMAETMRLLRPGPPPGRRRLRDHPRPPDRQGLCEEAGGRHQSGASDEKR